MTVAADLATLRDVLREDARQPGLDRALTALERVEAEIARLEQALTERLMGVDAQLAVQILTQRAHAAEAEAARLRDGLRRIELWPVDVGHTPEHDLLRIKDEARALLAEDGAA